MVYNKTKRKIEKASGIFGTVFSSLLFVFWALFVFAVFHGIFNHYFYPKMSQVLIIFSEFFFSLLSLIFYAMVIKSPVQFDETIKNRKAIRICTIIFSVLSGQLATAGLMIVVLCMKDEVQEEPTEEIKDKIVFNTTKRGLEMASGIVGVIISSILCVLWLWGTIELMDHSIRFGIPTDRFFSLIGVILEFVFSVLLLVFYAMLIKSPMEEGRITKDRTNLRIYTFIFSVLTGQFVTAALILTVTLIKDFKPVEIKKTIIPKVKVEQKVEHKVEHPTKKPFATSVESKIAELNHYKDLGVLDEEAYKKAVERLVNEIVG